MKTVIEARNLYKSYDIGGKVKIGVLRDTIIDTFKYPYRLLFKKFNKDKITYKALNGISFKVNQGEVLGLIGKNGAGKSTLLKVLSKITEPSGGEVRLRGRVSSLIEVGTGFHLELTGRENIYLNGAILGMRKKEIELKFDQIVEFSGIKNYLDVPVKRYSSGMYVRLAFAVAAHLDTDILLVDEVLSVGDADFQQKSLGKVKDIAESGRTIIFVSHNMGVISQLCTRCIVLSKGKIIFDGKTNEAIANYLSKEYEYFGSRIVKKDNKKIMQIRKVTISNSNKTPSGVLNISEPIKINIVFDVNKVVSGSVIYANINSVEGVLILKSTDSLNIPKTRYKGKYRSVLELPPYLINSGKYFLSLGCEVPQKNNIKVEEFDHLDAFQFECVDKSKAIDEYGSGIIAPIYQLNTQKLK